MAKETASLPIALDNYLSGSKFFNLERKARLDRQKIAAMGH
jgi:hypothetical protein